MAPPRSALRNRLELAAYHLIRGLLQLLPLRAAESLGRGTGRLYRFLDRRRRRLVRENLTFAFPEKTPAEIERLAGDSFAHLGGLTADLLRSGTAPLERILSRIEVSGLEHARAAASSGRGVFCATSHLGNWEWPALVSGANGIPATIVARPSDNPLLDARLTAMRERTGCRIVSKRSAGRALLKTVRGGGVVGILADQRARPPDAALVPFFGRLAWTTTSIARLVEQTGALILPAVCLRTAPGRYRVVFSEALDPRTFPPEDRGVVPLTARITALVESQIREAPEQWLWLHDRWRR